jgi:hypothetical protein
MLNLTSTTDLLQIINAGTVNVQVVVDYVDASSGGNVFTPGNQPTLITSAATTTICNSPGASVQRGVSHILIQNTGTSAAAIQVQRIAGSTTTNALPNASGIVTIPAGYSLEYNEQNGWVLIDKSLGRVETPLAGRLIARTVLSSGTTFTTTASTNTIIIKGVGGGGGGGGCSSVAAAAAAAGGGQAGGYLEKTVATAPNTVLAYTIGAAGSNASGAAGGNGGSSTFVVGGVTYTAGPGNGAALATASTTVTANTGGNGGATSTTGDLNTAGQPGGNGTVMLVGAGTTEVVSGGIGGSSPFGAGGTGAAAPGAGGAATGFGAGGGGSATGASAARAGGAPTGGCWVVEEYS